MYNKAKFSHIRILYGNKDPVNNCTVTTYPVVSQPAQFA